MIKEQPGIGGTFGSWLGERLAPLGVGGRGDGVADDGERGPRSRMGTSASNVPS